MVNTCIDLKVNHLPRFYCFHENSMNISLVCLLYLFAYLKVEKVSKSFKKILLVFGLHSFCIVWTQRKIKIQHFA